VHSTGSLNIAFNSFQLSGFGSVSEFQCARSSCCKHWLSFLSCAQTAAFWMAYLRTMES